MPVSNKRRAQAKAARAKQLQASRAQSCTSSTPLEYSATTNDHPNNTHHPPFEPYVCPIRYPNDVHDDVHWEGLSESEEESDVEMSEPEDHVLDEGKNAFDTMMQAREGPENGTGGGRLMYQRGATLCERQERRKRATNHEFREAAKLHSQPIAQFFSSISQNPPAAPLSKEEQREHAIHDLETTLNSKTSGLKGQNLVRHRAVLALMYITRDRKLHETRDDLSHQVSRTYGRGVYFARKLVQWEGTWIRNRKIEVGRRGCNSKVTSWFNDEGVHLAVREWCAEQGEGRYFLSI